jgi:hypothetical protein
VFLYFAQLRRTEALWSFATVLGGALIYRFYIRTATTPTR